MESGGFFLHLTTVLFEVVVDIVAGAFVHTQLAEGGSLGVNNEDKRCEHLALLAGGGDGDGLLAVLGGDGHIFARRDWLAIDDGIQHFLESGKLGVLLAVGDMFLAVHNHRELGAVHDELVASLIGGDADIVRLADGQRSCADSIGSQGCLMTGTCYILCLCEAK